MATKQSYDFLTTFVKEVTYGTAVTTPTDKVLMKIEWDEGIRENEIYEQQQTPIDRITTLRGGRLNPTFTAEGEFNDGMTFLLDAITQDNTTARNFPSVATLGWGHTVTYGKPDSSSDLGSGDLMTGGFMGA